MTLKQRLGLPSYSYAQIVRLFGSAILTGAGIACLIIGMAYLAFKLSAGG